MIELWQKVHSLCFIQQWEKEKKTEIAECTDSTLETRPDKSELQNVRLEEFEEHFPTSSRKIKQN